MRRSALAMIKTMIGFSLLASGCGNSTVDLTADLTPTELEPTELVPGEPAPAELATDGVARVVAAAEATASVSFRMDLVAEFGGLDEFGGEAVSFRMSSAFSADGEFAMMLLDFGDVLTAAAAQGSLGGPDLAGLLSEPIEMRVVGSTTYMSSSFISWLFPVETPWVAFEGDSSVQDTGFDMQAFSADEFLSLFGSMNADAEVVGVEVIDGVNTTHVRGTVSVAALVAAGDEAFFADLDPTGTGALDLTGADAFDIDVWIGDDEILRKMRFGVDDLSALDPDAPSGSFFRFTIDFSSVGEPIVVEAPPADQVTFMDDLFAGGFGFAD